MLLAIIDEVYPADMENFSLSCKQIYCLSRDLVKEVKSFDAEMAYRYAVIYRKHQCRPEYYLNGCGNLYCYLGDLVNPAAQQSRGLCEYHRTRSCPVCLICLLDEAPRLARLATTVSPASQSSHREFLSEEVSQRISEAVNRTLDKAPYKFEDKQAVIKGILNFHWDPAMAALLSLLSDVQELSLEDSEHSAEAPILESAVKQIAAGKSGNSIPHALAKLELTTIVGFVTMNLAASFASLPSMRELKICYFRREPVSFTGWHFNHASRLTALCIKCCYADTVIVATFLLGLPKLQKFHYIANDSKARLTAEVHMAVDKKRLPSCIIAALRETCRASLEMLNLQLCALSRNKYEEKAMFLGYLKDFPRLRSVCTETGFLVQDGITHRLVDIFPPSLEALRLIPSRITIKRVNEEAAVAILKDLPERKAELLPNLQHVIFRYGKVDIAIWKACRVRGVNVVQEETLPYCWELHVGQSE
ncbi:MAG: hypothetical protein MMC33_006902, partial [Icmadophila ericetorum]|nr:hypothetical protein [Icmadophila ericetorum]